MKTIDQILLVLTAVVVIYVLLKNKNIENLTIEQYVQNEQYDQNYGNDENEEKNYYETENKEIVDVEYNLINEMKNENDYELISS